MVHFEDLRQTAFQAEKDLNSYQAKQGLNNQSDSGKLAISGRPRASFTDKFIQCLSLVSMNQLPSALLPMELTSSTALAQPPLEATTARSLRMREVPGMTVAGKKL